VPGLLVRNKLMDIIYYGVLQLAGGDHFKSLLLAAFEQHCGCCFMFIIIDHKLGTTLWLLFYVYYYYYYRS